jgi:hypothetical protein
VRQPIAPILALAILTTATLLFAGDEKPKYLPPATSEGAKDLKLDQLAELPLKLPEAQFIGTPSKIQDIRVDAKTLGKKRGPFLAPKGVELISKGKPATISDPSPLVGDASVITDGDKEGTPGSLVEMATGRQWAQVDLGQPHELWAIVIWHAHEDPRVYRDVIVQISDDPAFANGVQTLFNNDDDNSSELGLGLGKDFEYFESNEGKLIDAKGKKARYVRSYTRGNTANTQNHVTEIEVWAKPAR